MIKEIDFETFLYVSNNEYQIFVFDKKKSERLYYQDLKAYNELDSKNFNDLSKFLDENIYKIEKLIGNFIKNIILIIENSENLNTNIAIKKRNYDKDISQKYLETNLIELKDLFKENYQDQIIMHMVIINNTTSRNKNLLHYRDVNNDNLHIEVNFISISNELTFIFDKLLEKYQIKISQYMCGNYIKNFFDKNTSELSLMAHKLKNGLNENEVILIPRNIENKGFFEKFFQLFS
jgi:hypothetical protein